MAERQRTYIVCYHLLPRPDDEQHEDVYGVNPDRMPEPDIEVALSEMDGVRVLGDAWIVQGAWKSRELRDKLKACLEPGDFLLVSRIRLSSTRGKGIGDALKLLRGG